MQVVVVAVNSGTNENPSSKTGATSSHQEQHALYRKLMAKPCCPDNSDSAVARQQP